MKEGDVWLLLLLGLAGMYLLFRGSPPQTGVTAKAVALPKPQTISNEETWRWRDWEGNSREITVTRKVKVDG